MISFVLSSYRQTSSLAVHLCRTVVRHDLNSRRRCSVIRGTVTNISCAFSFMRYRFTTDICFLQFPALWPQCFENLFLRLPVWPGHAELPMDDIQLSSSSPCGVPTCRVPV